MPIISFSRNNCLPNSNAGETEIANSANIAGAITFSKLNVTSPTGCLAFIIRVYKNGIRAFTFQTLANEINSIDEALNLQVGKGSSISVTVTNNDTNPHTFEGSLS